MAEKQSLPGRPARPDESRLVFLGTLTKPQGIKGGIRMLPEFDDLDDFEFLKTDRLFLKPAVSVSSLRPQSTDDLGYREITLDEFQAHHRFLVLFFEDTPDMNAADILRNHEVYVYEDEMWDLPEGKFYTYQLVGLELFDLTTNSVAGSVKELRPGVQDYLVISGAAGEFLVPYVPEIVLKVDLETRRIEARIPEGLAEI